MSPLPGYTVEIVPTAPNPATLQEIGTGFPIGTATTPGEGWVYSIDQFQSTFGARDPSSPLYDSVNEFFKEGGYRAFVSAAALNATPAAVAALLSNITPDLGPGAIWAPGNDDLATQEAIASFCDQKGYLGLLHATDSNLAADLVTAAEALTNQVGDKWCGLFAPWDVVPGITPGTTLTIPPEGRIAGNLARNDALGYSPDDAAAGVLGIAQFATGLSQPAWSDGDRANLNAAGVNVTRMIYNVPRTYGFRSLASQTNNPDWSYLASSRTIVAIRAVLNIVAENFVFSKLDGQGVTLNRWKAALGGAIQPFYDDNALYGATAAEAFSVGVGPDVNTDATFAAGQLLAKIGLRTSSMAEQVTIMVAKVPITQSLLAA